MLMNMMMLQVLFQSHKSRIQRFIYVELLLEIGVNKCVLDTLPQPLHTQCVANSYLIASVFRIGSGSRWMDG